MQLSDIAAVAKREYLVRIKAKGFWIATLILPLFLTAVSVVPSLLLAKSEARQKVVVVDQTGRVAADLKQALETRQQKTAEPGAKPEKRRNRMAKFDLVVEPPQGDPTAQRAGLDRRVVAKEIDAWLWIGPEALTDNKVEYHARSVSNFFTQDVLTDDVSAAVRKVRLDQAGLDPERIGKLTEPIELSTVRVSKEGSRAEGGFAGAAFAYILFMLLYLTLAIWGQQVMLGILDEKSSRVIEVLVSTLKPFDLMLGKLSGICLLGLTQITIWLTTLGLVTAPGVLVAMGALPDDIVLPRLTVAMALHFVALFILGFFAFSTLYAAIGASFNNVQEAQQVAGIVIFFLIAPLALMYRVINDPDSTLSVVASLIPPFSPLLMTLRIGVQIPPLWQILLCDALLLAFIWVMITVCARIYRVGILMYGKKPTLQEILRWVRYA